MEKAVNYKTGNIFSKILYISVFSIILLVAAIFVLLVLNAMPSIKAFGFNFIADTTWDPITGEFSCLSFIVGTFMSAFLAMLISIPFSLAISISMGVYFRGSKIGAFLKSVVELLAGVPSIIYGFWGLFVLVPLIRTMEIKFNIIPYGVGVFTSSLILAIMIIPYTASIGSEIIGMVPKDLKEAAYSLGATKFEVITKVILPYARSGLSAGILLSLGRAIGETMAVTMVIGNSNFLPKSIFSPANTMASVIANEFTEATEDIYLSSLMEIGLLLFIITAIVNILGKYIIKKSSVEV